MSRSSAATALVPPTPTSELTPAQLRLARAIARAVIQAALRDMRAERAARAALEPG